MDELPRGTVTFLFTDIEGSTRLVRRERELFGELLAAHRRILRGACTSGHEFGTEGDAVFVVFERASDAVRAAVDAQRALHSHAWPSGCEVRVRMGVHAGEATVSDGDYVGLAVHVAARVCAAAHGGQILASRSTRDLAEPEPPTSMRSLGLHRLKDLAEAEELFEIRHPDLPDGFAPPRTLGSAHNLPPQRTPLLGREREVAEVRGHLAEHRLVTLTGVGGTGKTRLAIGVGMGEASAHPDGCRFCDLSAVTDPSAVDAAVGAAAGLSQGGFGGSSGRSARDDVLTLLGGRDLVLVLDNCEHVLDACADLADAVLTWCPDVRMLATSREPLRVPGEQAYPVPPLGDASLQLFADRAAAVRPGFELDGDNRAAAEEICARLDGIPLAIELAAARVAHLSPRQIADRLGDRFRLLTGGHTRVRRQQTLAAAMDWSHDLLTPDERTLLRSLSVFAGGFSLEAAEAVCGDGIGEPVMDVLGALVARSLVLPEDTGATLRYRLLETVRAYAAAKLDEAGEAEDLRDRHLDHFVVLAGAVPALDLWISTSARRTLIGELDNLRTAAVRALGKGDLERLATLAAPLTGLSALAAWPAIQDSYRWTRLCADGMLPGALRVQTLAAASAASLLEGDGLVDEWAALAVDASDGTPSGALVFALLMRSLWAGMYAAIGADDERKAAAYAFAEQAASVAATLGAWREYALVFDGMTALMNGDMERALRSSRAVLDLDDAREHATVAGAGLLNIIVAAHVVGDDDASIDAALQLAPLAAMHSYQGFCSSAFLAVPLAACGDIARAREELRTARAIMHSTGATDVPGVANELLVCVAAVEAMAGDHQRASRLIGAVRAEGVLVTRGPASWALRKHYIRLVRDALGPEAARRARDQGAAMTRDEAVASAFGDQQG